MRRWAVVVMMAIGACGGGSSTERDAPAGDGATDDGTMPDAFAGQRLKRVWLDFDGTRVPHGTYDAALGIRCEPARWDDGKTYCSPEPTAIVGFADPACTQPIGVVYDFDPACANPPPAYITSWVEQPCSAQGSGLGAVYRAGPQLALAGHYLRWPDGTCEGPTPAEGVVTYYEAGAEVPRTAFVELTQPVPVATDRYAERYHEAADGARLPAGAYDSILGVSCNLAKESASAGRCYPAEASYTLLYSDAQCSRPGGVANAGCPAPAFIAHYAGAACPEDDVPAFRMTGAPVSRLYERSGATCGVIPFDGALDYYAAGAPVAVPPLSWEREAVTRQQIQKSRFVDGATALPDFRVFDSDHDIECVPTWIDGAWRCRWMDAPLAEAFYTDASCQTPIMLAPVPRSGAGCDPPEVPGLARRYGGSTDACVYVDQAYRMGAPYTGSRYVDYGFGCQPAAADPTVTWYRVGAPVGFDAMAIGVEVIDP